jgi:thiol-disulfide isomerase/thioredoxin
VLATLAVAAALLAGCAKPDPAGVGPVVDEPDVAERAERAGRASRSVLDSPEAASARARATTASCETLRGPASTVSSGEKPSGEKPSGGGSPLPDVTLACLGPGPEVSLREMSGRPAVLNVWAQWCGPCREESPLFQALYERAGDELVVAGINYDDPRPDLALAFVDTLGLSYPQLADPERRLRAPFGLAAGIPATVFVSAQGRIVHIAHKPYGSERDLLRDVRTHLGVDL